MCEFPQYWRDVGRNVGVPFTAVNEVPRVTSSIQKREPRDFFSGDTQAIELQLKVVAIDPHQAHLGERLLRLLAGQGGGDAVTRFAVGHDQPEYERFAGSCRQLTLIDEFGLEIARDV